MRSLTFRYLPSLLILCLLVRMPTFAQNHYFTVFNSTENPISEGGRWLNGASVGIDWCDVETVGNRAQAVPPCTSPGGFNDPIAILTGTWATTQVAVAKVWVSPDGPGPALSYPEVEVWTNGTMTPHNNTGYEFDCGLNPVGSAGSVGFAIVRHDGPVPQFPNNSNKAFTYLVMNSNVMGCQNGTVLMGVNTGEAVNNLKMYANGVLVAQATDHTYTGGAPGIGFDAGEGASSSLSGLTSFYATDTWPGAFDPSLYGVASLWHTGI
jgi:hypothetical protein